MQFKTNFTHKNQKGEKKDLLAQQIKIKSTS